METMQARRTQEIQKLLEKYDGYAQPIIMFSLINSVLQCTTQRVYSKRDLFKTLTSMNIARDHHNRII